MLNIIAPFRPTTTRAHIPAPTVDVVYTWKYGGPHIITTICANEMKLCVYNGYVL